MSDEACNGGAPSGRMSSVYVPLIGTLAALLAAGVSGFLVWYTSERAGQLQERLNEKTGQLQERLSVIQQAQIATDQSIKLNLANRDFERQYVALVYNDLLAKDSSRQKAALSLLTVLAPETGLKLLAWAQQAKVILPENREASLEVKSNLEALQANGRLRLFLHVGQAKGRPLPELDAIGKALSEDGYSVLGTDNQADAYGPGVDYFDLGTKPAAEKIAKILTSLLPAGATPIAARKQSTPNHQGTIGIWF